MKLCFIQSHFSVTLRIKAREHGIMESILFSSCGLQVVSWDALGFLFILICLMTLVYDRSGRSRPSAKGGGGKAL